MSTHRLAQLARFIRGPASTADKPEDQHSPNDIAADDTAGDPTDGNTSDETQATA